MTPNIEQLQIADPKANKLLKRAVTDIEKILEKLNGKLAPKYGGVAAAAAVYQVVVSVGVHMSTSIPDQALDEWFDKVKELCRNALPNQP